MSKNPPIHFLISAPRSGSTWLTTALNCHPEIFATEHRLFGNFAEIWHNNDGTTSPRLTFDSYANAFSVHYFFDELGLNRDQFTEAFQKSFIDFLVSFAMQRKAAKVVVDKITPYPGTSALVVKRIRQLCPGARIMQLVRDGRDVVTSGTFDWLLKDAAGTDRYAYFVEQNHQANLARFFDDEAIIKWANNWRETVEIFEATPADTQVRYENMTACLEDELAKVFEVLGVEELPEIGKRAKEVTSFESMSGRQAGDQDPTAKVRKGVVGDWRNYFTKTDAQLFDQIAGVQLYQLGYERDSNWINECPTQLDLSVG